MPPTPATPVLNTFIVEDSPIILDKLVALLEELAPVQVVGTAASEATARHWLAQPGKHCDLLIVDLFLASGSGLGVLQACTAHPARRVVLSNYASPEMRQRCLALGADRVFDKSSEIDELLDFCRSLARARPD